MSHHVASPHTNGLLEGLIRTAEGEFFFVALKRKVYTTIDELQEDFDQWIVH